MNNGQVNSYWRIYAVGGPYTTNAAIGTLAPSQFGGLSYKILEEKRNHIYIIQTESYGAVAIWAGDSDSTFTSRPAYKDNNGPQTSVGVDWYFINLHPNVTSWRVYKPKGPYTDATVVGRLNPSQYGGLSYKIITSGIQKDFYIIQTESYGQVAIYRDGDASLTLTPMYQEGNYNTGSVKPTVSSGKYLNLKPIPSWRVYAVDGPYTTANAVGSLAPAQFGGLSYAILGNPTKDIYIIQTESYGRVAIWAGDSDSTFSSSPVYKEGSSAGGQLEGSPTIKFVNLKPIPSWRVYAQSGPYTSASAIGTLAPAQFGGLSYAILGNPAKDIYIIQTENYGRVAIWAGDNDSTFTASPTYATGDTAQSSIGGSGSGLYLNGDQGSGVIDIKPRSFWGAKPYDFRGMDGTRDTNKLNRVIIHHSAGYGSSEIGYMRSIQNYHQSNSAIGGDVGYHYCIGPTGTIYEGRGINYIGAHTSRYQDGVFYNELSIGVCLLGDFSGTLPTVAQQKSLVNLTAYLCKKYNIAPNRITGHRDHNSTTCPGNYFYQQTNRLETIRTAVSTRMKISDITNVTPVKPAPNLSQIKQQIVNYINGELNKTADFFAKRIPINVDLFETDYVVTVAPNIIMKASLSMDNGSDMSEYYSVNITQTKGELETIFGKFRQMLKDNQISFESSLGSEDIIKALGGKTNVDQRVGIGLENNKMMFSYSLIYKSIPIPNGNPVSSVLKIKFIVDDNTFRRRVPVEQPHGQPVLEITPIKNVDILEYFRNTANNVVSGVLSELKMFADSLIPIIAIAFLFYLIIVGFPSAVAGGTTVTIAALLVILLQ